MKHYFKSFYRYHLRGRWLYWKAQKELKNKQIPILIYSMGKVGSLSLYHSLQQQEKRPTYHLHSLQKQRIDWEYQTCRKKGWWPDSRSVGDLIYQQKIKTKQPIKIITAVREPIERNVSAFFEVFKYYNGVEARKFDGNQSDLQQQFLEKIPHLFPLEWLDKELKKCLDIDLYLSDFDPVQKYAYYQKNNLKLLLWRVDLDDQEKEEQIISFLGLNKFKLTNTNIGSTKDYAQLYQDFKMQLELPKSYLEQLLESKYCHHFYSYSERKKIYQKWLK